MREIELWFTHAITKRYQIGKLLFSMKTIYVNRFDFCLFCSYTSEGQLTMWSARLLQSLSRVSPANNFAYRMVKLEMVNFGSVHNQFSASPAHLVWSSWVGIWWKAVFISNKIFTSKNTAIYIVVAFGFVIYFCLIVDLLLPKILLRIF